MRHPVRLPSEVKLALIVIALIVVYALYRVGLPAVALASNAVAAIAGWMGRGLSDRIAGPTAVPGEPRSSGPPTPAPAPDGSQP